MKNILKFALFQNVVHSMKFGDVHVSSSVGDRRSEKNLDCDPIANFKNLQLSMMPSFNLILFKKNATVKYKISENQSK